MTGELWEQYEIDFLLEVYETMPAAQIALKLERTRSAVYVMANYFGLRKPLSARGVRMDRRAA